MRFNEKRQQQIFVRTSGYCHICHAKLDFDKYGDVGKEGAWEVEHSTPQAKGGTHHLNNLYPACITVIVLKVIIALARHGQNMVKNAHLCRA
jgi:hypothetical protein